MKILNKIKKYLKTIGEMNERIKVLQDAVGRIETRQVTVSGNTTVEASEFKVHSQWGEDGIIQYLLHKVSIETPIFVEFGVERYIESNTRFLLMNDNWSGLVLDGGQENIDYIKRDPIYWKYNLKTECAFIDKNNINELIQKNGISGDIGLLSVDIDGNDYWIWDAIDVIQPRIVICEYNSLFGAREKVTVPYDTRFFRTTAHYSNLFYGASIAALTQLANEKGYALVAGNKAGNNIFFVRRDLMQRLEEKDCEAVYVESKFRESRDEAGQLTFLSMQERLNLLKDMSVVNIESGQKQSIKELYAVE